MCKIERFFKEVFIHHSVFFHRRKNFLPTGSFGDFERFVRFADAFVGVAEIFEPENLKTRKIFETGQSVLKPEFSKSGNRIWRFLL